MSLSTVHNPRLSISILHDRLPLPTIACRPSPYAEIPFHAYPDTELTLACYLPPFIAPMFHLEPSHLTSAVTCPKAVLDTLPI